MGYPTQKPDNPQGSPQQETPTESPSETASILAPGSDGPSDPTTPTSTVHVDSDKATPPPSRRGSARARTAAPPRTFDPGTLVAERYRVVRFIAEGAMGEVYEAEDTALHGSIAVKTIRSEIAEDSKALDRFKREIHLARRVTHSNACRIFDLGHHRTDAETPPIAFLTMELLEGETLAARIARNPLSTGEALPILAQLAVGLDAAHSVGVIHRDFKSGNVMLTSWPDPRRGIRAVITDFGLARPIDPNASVASISDSGAVVGTPAYMAPEQVRGEHLTPATDLYSLGIVGYEMVTGVRPFDGGSAISVAVKRLTQAPTPPRVHAAHLDPLWEAAILKCLALDPKDRFPSCEAFVDVLRGAAPVPSIPSNTAPGLLTPVGPAPAVSLARRLWPWLAGASVGLALLAGGYFLRGHAARPTTAEPSAAPAAPVPVRPGLALMGIASPPRRPESEWISVALAELVARQLGAGDRLRIIPPEEVTRVRTDLGLTDSTVIPPASLPLLATNLGVRHLVTGSVSLLGGPESRLIRLDLQLTDATTGASVATATANGTDGQVFDLAVRAGDTLRDALQIGKLTATQALQVEAALPSSREAIRPYAEGLLLLRRQDPAGARKALEVAVKADPKHPALHAALAAALMDLGYRPRAAEEWKKAVALGGSLAPTEQLRLEARLEEAAGNWDKALAAYRQVWQLAPDDIDAGLALARAQIGAGKAKDATVVLEELQRLAPPIGEDPRLGIELARVAYYLGDPKRERDLANGAATVALAREAVSLRGHARILEGQALERLGDPVAARNAYEEARERFGAIGDRRHSMRALESIAVLIKLGGDLEGARRLFERALSFYRECGDESACARVLSNLGEVHLAQGDIQQAKALFGEALGIFRRTGARSEAAKVRINLGAQLQTKGLLVEAQRSYEEALQDLGELGDRGTTAATLTNLGELLLSRAELKQARAMQEEALAVSREIGDRSLEAYNLLRVGEILEAGGDLGAARQRFDEALALQVSTAEKTAAAETRLALALLLLEQDSPDEALAKAAEAEEGLRAENAIDRATVAGAVKASALVATGRKEEGRAILVGLTASISAAQDPEVRFQSVVATARLALADSHASELEASLTALDQLLAETKERGLLLRQFETRILVAEIHSTQKLTASRSELQRIKSEALGFGLLLIAAKADRLLTRSTR